jgi:hypothetical protein
MGEWASMECLLQQVCGDLESSEISLQIEQEDVHDAHRLMIVRWGTSGRQGSVPLLTKLTELLLPLRELGIWN